MKDHFSSLKILWIISVSIAQGIWDISTKLEDSKTRQNRRMSASNRVECNAYKILCQICLWAGYLPMLHYPYLQNDGNNGSHLTGCCGGLCIDLIYEREGQGKRRAQNNKDENPWEQWLLPEDHESPWQEAARLMWRSGSWSLTAQTLNKVPG